MQTAFYAPVDREYQRFSYRNILYIIAKGNYAIVVTVKGQKICIYATLCSLEEKLPVCLFARVHRSYIVCLKRVERFSKNFVTIRGEQIPISPDAYKLLQKRLNVISNDIDPEKIKGGNKENVEITHKQTTLNIVNGISE